MQENYIEIDGSFGEGGGQIIRTAISMSAVMGKSCRIFNIRKGRPNPGLQAQHLTAVKAVADICNAKVSGAKPGSLELTFNPEEIKGGKYSWDIGTAGSITLVIQALLPVVLDSRQSFEFRIKGGTDVTWSPPIEHFQHVFCDYLKKMGCLLEVDVLKHGFYPKGGGCVDVRIPPSRINPIHIEERGELEKLDIWSIASSNLKEARVTERQVIGFKSVFPDESTNIVHELYVNSSSPGSVIHAHAHFENCKIGAEAIGEKGISSEKIGKLCSARLESELNSDSTVDSHVLDQILTYIALAGGLVKFKELTNHAKTNIWVIEKFLPVKFKIDEKRHIISANSP